MQKYNEDIEYLKKYIKEKNLNEEYFNKCKEELLKGKPIQYIIGNVNFYGNIINVNKNVLIPRFETELLCEKTINKIKKLFNKQIDILDLGTGSGCIAITMKKELDCNVDAVDISTEALEVAKTNAMNNSTLINFINADMTKYKSKKYDVIISNPPYIRYDEEIMDIVKNNEPNIALYADDNGLYFYKKIIDNLPYITNPNYIVAFEIGEGQGKSISLYAKKKLDNISITIEKDLQGKERFVFICKVER